MGVDIMTRFRGSMQAKAVRNVVVTLGLIVLLALSYHSANGSPTSAPLNHAGHAEHQAAPQPGRQTSNQVENAGPSQSGKPGDAGRPKSGPPQQGPPASRGPAKPPPAKRNHPGNRPQTSLGQAAGREHPIKSDSPVRPGPPPKLRGKVPPSQALEKGATGFGGCLREYGENGQCVPVVPPSMASHVQDMKKAGLDASAMKHHWTCTELRTYFRNGVAVRQPDVDPQELDTNGDGTACGTGDG